MINIKTLFCIAGTSISSIAFSQIPNSGFESWENRSMGPFTYTDPVGWSTLNFMMTSQGLPMSAVKSTDAYEGQYAIKLVNVANPSIGNFPAFLSTQTEIAIGEYYNKFPITGKPASLEGYYKYDYVIQDTFNVVFNIYCNTELIGTGSLSISGKKSTYTKFSDSVLYFNNNKVPDSASIDISAGSLDVFKDGTVLYLDKLSFTGNLTAVDEVASKKKDLRIFPNPVANELNFGFDVSTYTEVSIFDITGKALLGHRLCSNNIAVESLSPGIYFVQLRQNDGSMDIIKFIKIEAVQ